MADRDLLVRIDANTTGYERAIARAEAQTKSFEYALRQAAAAQAKQDALLAKQAAARAKFIKDQKNAMNEFGRGMQVAGAGIAVGLGVATYAAAKWESAWTSVRKTVSGTPEQLAAVEKGIRDLSLTIPTSANDLAKIAASAGALGIKTPYIVDFTKTVAMLGETTDLVGEAGATSLARFANIMGTSQSQFDNLGASLVALGNNGASTESEIITLGLRLAAAGKYAGLSEGQVLGLSNAMSSLGIQAESGGTAMSRTMQQIGTAVAGGGKTLQAFADVSGVSSARFAQMWGTNAAGALTRFIAGLGRVKDAGGNVYGTLAQLGITSSRQVDTLTRLAGANQLVARSMRQGVSAYRQNIALTNEFAKRNATTEAALGRARNAAVEFAVGIGDGLLPAVATVANDLSGLMGMLGRMPGPAKDVVTAFGLAGTALLLFGGTALRSAKMLDELRTRMGLLVKNADGTYNRMGLARAGVGALGIAVAGLASQIDPANKALTGLGAAATGALIGFSVGGPWGAAIGGGIGLLGSLASSAGNAKDEVQALVDTLDSATGATTSDTRQLIAKDFIDSGVADAAKNLGIGISQVVTAAQQGGQSLAALREQLNQYRTAAAGVARGPGAVGAGSALSADAAKVNAALDDTQAKLQSAREAWRLQADAMAASADKGTFAADSLEQVAQAAGASEASVSNLTEAMQKLSNTLDKRSSMRDYQAAIDDATAALRQNGRTLNINTDAGRSNAAALDNIASTALKVAESVAKQTNSVDAGRKVIEQARGALYQQARAFGMSAAAAKRYVDQVLKVPKQMKTDVVLNTDRARQQVNALIALIRNANPTMTVAVATGTANKLTYSGIPRADGGLVRGPGGPRDDRAGLYALSNREYVQSAAAVDFYGVDFMAALNARRVPKVPGMAAGGTPGGSGSSGGGDMRALLSLARLLAMLARPEAFTTIAEVNNLIRQRNEEEKKLAVLLREQKAAREADKAAKGDKAQAEAAKALSKAEQAVTDQRSQLSDATDKWRAAQQALLEQSKAYAATVSSLGDAFGGEGTSLSAQGLLAKKRDAANSGRQFDIYLKVLRRKNLDEDLIAELRAQGPTADGLALAQSLATSAPGMIRRINRADDRLDRTARDVATFGVRGRRVPGQQPGRSAPIVNIERLVTADPDKAARAIVDRQRKALTLARLG